MMPPTILITGDLVLDHHLYEGARPNPQDRDQRALTDWIEWGGASLLCGLLQQVEREEKIDALWQKRTKAWEEACKSNLADEPKPPVRPDANDEDLKSVSAETQTHFAFGELPKANHAGISPLITTAHGYALFSPTPRNPMDSNLVWRVSKVLGYGEEVKARTNSTPALSPIPNLPTIHVVCLDDAGSVFRNLLEPMIWCLPTRETSPLPWVVLKLSGDLEHGLLWDELDKRTDLHPKMVVMIAAEGLRNMNVRLSKGLSWERSVEHLLFELARNPVLRRLKKLRHLIVHFSIDAAVWIHFSEDDNVRPQVVLVFDAANAEGEWAELFEGRAFAYQTCLAAAICRRLAMTGNSEVPDVDAIAKAMGSGLSAMRLLRSDGHGPTLDKAGALKPPEGFPIAALAGELLKPSHVFSHVVVPEPVWENVGKPEVTVGKANPNSSWTILSQTQNPHQTHRPLYGLARQIVLHGEIALSRLPHLRIGKFLTTDRTDMEALRTLRRLFIDYKSKSNPGKKPLSIGVFGPPGAGKSFAVKELTLGMFALPGAKEYAGWREFNISQFDSINDLMGAFHQVRDLVLQGHVPVVFWDEFDSSKYKWLQYLLAPMQDGRFQQGEATHTIGKCIFIFAGGTAWTFDSFGEFSTEQDRAQFQLAKGPDFKSRLDGVYDVLGPNRSVIAPKDTTGKPDHAAPTGKWERNLNDIYFPIRRALMIRGLIGAKPGEKIEFDPGLLTALLQCDFYIHGARSLEKVIEPLTRRKNLLDQVQTPVRAALPAPNQLRLHVRNPETFHQLCGENFPLAMLNEGIILRLAQAIHAYWHGGIRSRGAFNSNAQAWEMLDDEIKRSNMCAARRMPEVLSLAGLYLAPEEEGPGEHSEIREYLSLHLDLLAEAEHDGWVKDKKDNDWSYGEKRNDKKKRHPCLKPFVQLPVVEQNKNREAVLRYVDLADLIGYKIAFVKEPEESEA